MTTGRRPSDLRGPAEDLGLPDPEVVAALRWPVQVSAEPDAVERGDFVRPPERAGGWVSPEGIILDLWDAVLAAAWPDVRCDYWLSKDTGGLVFTAYGLRMEFSIKDWETRRMVLRWWMTGQPTSMLANATLAASDFYSEEAEDDIDLNTDPEGAEE